MYRPSLKWVPQVFQVLTVDQDQRERSIEALLPFVRSCVSEADIHRKSIGNGWKWARIDEIGWEKAWKRHGKRHRNAVREGQHFTLVPILVGGLMSEKAEEYVASCRPIWRCLA